MSTKEEPKKDDPSADATKMFKTFKQLLDKIIEAATKLLQSLLGGKGLMGGDSLSANKGSGLSFGGGAGGGRAPTEAEIHKGIDDFASKAKTQFGPLAKAFGLGDKFNSFVDKVSNVAKEQTKGWDKMSDKDREKAISDGISKVENIAKDEVIGMKKAPDTASISQKDLKEEVKEASNPADTQRDELAAEQKAEAKAEAQMDNQDEPSSPGLK